MSSYYKQTKHPQTGKWENAEWIDDYYGKHKYGVKFSDGYICNPDQIHLETREEVESNTLNTSDVIVQKTKVAYTVKVPIAPQVAGTIAGNTLEATVTIDIPTGRITIQKAGQFTRGNTRDYNFIDSRNGIVEAVGKMLLEAARISREVITNK